MIVDTCGRACPEPLIITKRAIAAAEAGSSVEVLSDNTTSRTNLMSYLTSLGFAPQCSTDSTGIFHILFSLEGAYSSPVWEPDVNNYPSCSTTYRQGGYAVVIRSSVMGAGDDELGALLMRSCVNSLGELDSLPAIVVLYNSGVILAAEGADTVESLKKLCDAGVNVVVCGTCVDFFNIKDKLAVGEIGNMLTINNLLAASTHIIYP